jgi:hypothetical protein
MTNDTLSPDQRAELLDRENKRRDRAIAQLASVVYRFGSMRPLGPVGRGRMTHEAPDALEILDELAEPPFEYREGA